MEKLKYDYLEDQYHELALLGSPEKSSTYLVQDQVSGRIAVKKYISLENASIYRRLKKISHRNLIRIFHIAESEKNALVLMEYVSGQTLEEYLSEGNIFSEAETREYMCQLLRGLSAIHRENIIHRDISPKNILISTDKVLKILDFDIGRLYRPGERCDTHILGTPGYAAPEQFGGGQSDRRTDIYSAGILMNVMLTGLLPREKLYEKGLPGRMIRRCIQTGPEQRYQSASAFLAVLEGYLPQKSIWPGFRSGTLWKKITAVSYYILMGLYSAASIAECAKTPLGAGLELAAILLYGWLTVFIPLNFLHWMERLPLVRRLNQTGKTVLSLILLFLLFYGGMSLEQYVRIDLLHLSSRAA